MSAGGAGVALECLRRGLRLPQPELHTRLAEHLGSAVDVLLRFRPVARLSGKLAESEMTLC